MQAEQLQGIYFKPSLPEAELYKKYGDKPAKQTLSLQYYLTYCHYTLLKLQQIFQANPTQIPSQIRSTICSLITCNVTATEMPCLIYEHVCETFCSLVEAWTDADIELARREIQELRETINSYNRDRQYRDYQSFNHLEIDENMTDTLLKEKFYSKVMYLMEEYKKFGDTTNVKPSTKKVNKSNKDRKGQIMQLIKQKQLKLKQRYEENIKNKLARICGKGKKNTQEENKKEKENEEREFVIRNILKKIGD